MRLRRRMALALDPALKKTIGLSLTNKVITLIILLSLFLDILETENTLYQSHLHIFQFYEWIFTDVFILEYIFRVWVSVENPTNSGRLHYIYTPTALLDLVTLLVIVFTATGSNGFILRLARLLQVFRIARLGHYSLAMKEIGLAVYLRRFELTLCLVIGFFALIFTSCLLYLLEGKVQPEGFGSIPRAMWWSIVTLTTVGYGDVHPITAAGKFAAALTAVIGIALIALPTGILAASFSEAVQDLKRKHRKKVQSSEEKD